MASLASTVFQKTFFAVEADSCIDRLCLWDFVFLMLLELNFITLGDSRTTLGAARHHF